jgi:Arc/MetJ family transcription regulator
VKARKNYRLDEELLRKAQRLLGTTTETDTITQALRRLTEAGQELKLLRRSRGKYPEFRNPYHQEA